MSMVSKSNVRRSVTFLLEPATHASIDQRRGIGVGCGLSARQSYCPQVDSHARDHREIGIARPTRVS